MSIWGDVIDDFMKELPLEVDIDELLEAEDAGEIDMPDALIEEDFTKDVDTRLDAKEQLKKLPKRLILIAQKRIDGKTLTQKERAYLSYWRSKLKRD